MTHVVAHPTRLKVIRDTCKRIRQAEPGTPTEALGLDGVPQAGDRFCVTPAHAGALPRRVIESNITGRIGTRVPHTSGDLQ